MPTIWLLGSSDYSARLAAEKGMPYVFAHHFSGSGTAEALALYRSTFRPSPELAEPRTFLTVNASVAETDEEAAGWRCPSSRRCWRCAPAASSGRSGWSRRPRRSSCRRPTWTWWTRWPQRWVIGSPETARARIAELAATYGVDEVMVHPVAGAYTGTDPDRSPAREETLRLLAG